MKKLRVWWIPQVPGKPFYVPVETINEGVKIMDLLADYDDFQFKNHIKPDYSNAGGLEQWNKDDLEWEDWWDEETAEDDPHEYLSLLDDDTTNILSDVSEEP